MRVAVRSFQRLDPTAVQATVDRLVMRIPRGFQWLSVLESGIVDVVYASIAVYFLMSLPNRLTRRRLLALMHRLRSLAHVVDMHQLTKDPERLQERFHGTEATIAFTLDAAE